MRTIIIGDGLSRSYLSPELPFRDSKSNVGRSESERLLGKGKLFGKGPLPTFLRCSLEARSAGADVEVVLLEASGENPDAFVDALEDMARQATVIASPPHTLPWKELGEAFSEFSRADSGEDATRFLVVGSHTEHRIAALATFLRNVLGHTQVAVAVHLVGSATAAAHFAALRHNLPGAGIRVILDLEEAATFAGLEPADFAQLNCRPCEVTPAEARDALDPAQRRIIELLCTHWTQTRLRPLAGGFSGSLLLLADGWKGEARTEPLVLKIDSFGQMRRELAGYHLVKDFFGKHVPTFGYPVLEGDFIGVGMELAAMEGRPRTLQDAFEEADSEESLRQFTRRLDKALSLLCEKLYRNTQEPARVVPYRAFGIHAEKHQKRLQENAELAISYMGSDLPGDARPNPRQLRKLLRLVSSNEDGMDGEICLGHGDLNCANIICDEVDNLWFIDWTHSGLAPVELDFAKLENDVKFVMSKDFDKDDLGRLKKLEEYLLAQHIPADANNLPERLKFAKWDLRFGKILGAVRTIREACFGLKEADQWLVYRVALLRYALHTLSFDRRRDRGECDPPQLMHALYSVEALLFDLVADDFHLKIRGECPTAYPPRQRISIDESLWMMECPEYAPPYYVDPSVVGNDRRTNQDGWADPEDFDAVKGDARVRATKHHDEAGRPLNPRGRTGIAGRGLLGLWGVNLSVAATVVRRNEDTGEMEILLGNKEGSQDLDLPKGFVLPDETSESAIVRVLGSETGWHPPDSAGEVVFEGYTYDLRQTDHAWVETRVTLVHAGNDVRRADLNPGGVFDEVGWWPLDASTVNRIPSGQARFVRESLTRLQESGHLTKETAEKLLAATG